MSTVVSQQPPVPPDAPSARAGNRAKYGIAAAFLAPAAFFVGVWMIYPTIYTIVRSFFANTGGFGEFVGIDNYTALFTNDTLLTAIKNNAIWVAVVPAAVTALGLLFAVLTERVRWSLAFKAVVFMPLAVSLFAAGVIWRIQYEKNPESGAVNAAISAGKGVFSETGVLSTAKPSTDAVQGTPRGGLTLEDTLQPGDVATLGLTAVSATEVPEGAEQAVQPEPLQGGITGVVWRDFKPGGGEAGKVEEEEVGLPGVTVELRDSDGRSIESVTTEANGTFAFEEVPGGDYNVAIGAATFAQPFGGVNWLGAKLITPAIIIAYLWTAAGFAMVITAAGLASIPRDTLEAARTDGASEWQVFRRVTVPLLAPVLTVVFVTQIIGVLKVFDIVLAIAPGSSRDDATVVALEMWLRAFSGENQFGVGAALATFLLVSVLLVGMFNIRRFRREAM